MILLLVGLVSLFVLGKGKLVTDNSVPSNGGGSPVPDTTPSRPVAGAVATPVIKDSVGGSLSQALGNVQRSPRYYATGNPGTTGITLPPSSTIAFYKPKWTPPPIVKTISNPYGAQDVTQNKPFPVVKTTEQTAVGVKRVSSALVNPRQTSRGFIKPEWPAAFWTKRYKQ